MANAGAIARWRRALDRKLAGLRPADKFAAPPKGWIKAVREALGMSQTDLARRMQVAQATVVAAERSEAGGKIQLDTLRRVADAMDCELVYALVPRHGLDSTLRDAAREKLSPHLRAVSQTMSLEDQASSPEADLIEDEIARLIESGRVWK
jgi:predicted DNA-binding mobile mystery protein A